MTTFVEQVREMGVKRAVVTKADEIVERVTAGMNITDIRAALRGDEPRGHHLHPAAALLHQYRQPPPPLIVRFLACALSISLIVEEFTNCLLTIMTRCVIL